jgi:hypothetical protein
MPAALLEGLWRAHVRGGPTACCTSPEPHWLCGTLPPLSIPRALQASTSPQLYTQSLPSTALWLPFVPAGPVCLPLALQSSSSGNGLQRAAYRLRAKLLQRRDIKECGSEEQGKQRVLVHLLSRSQEFVNLTRTHGHISTDPLGGITLLRSTLPCACTQRKGGAQPPHLASQALAVQRRHIPSTQGQSANVP